MIRQHADRVARWLHRLFEASLVVKGLLATAEAASGLGLLLTPNTVIQGFVAWMTRNELAEDPGDAMAQWVERLAHSFSIGLQHFYALYLLSHGLLKLLMVLLLAARVSWAYPASMAVLAGFILYQLQQWTASGSLPLLALSAFDAVMIALIWREWRALRHSVPG
ncbi:DUF2127 domain-containing protein [Albidovulum sediminicola]|uniref:DUF2127 domain-containing protein n=1 Tax=Albidovulum sediminicola TaxID=2984331 RepID=A0ABT2Z0K3_9RHOB|nr:DUF2127 domain-containing protein [Defluviimonas sp. WL0075]MCV2864683.1 DUF2127 domain-containing protein [Defluviimonas sp. WL0075]